MDNFTPDMNEKLVLYLDDVLTGTEKQVLEQQLAADASLREQFNSLLSTREALRLYGLKQKVAGIHAEMMRQLQTPVVKMRSARKTIRYITAVAASLLLIIGGYMQP